MRRPTAATEEGTERNGAPLDSPSWRWGVGGARPSTKSSSLSSSLAAAWAGGLRGREVVDRILYDIKSWLRPNGGTFLVVAYAQNDIEEMMSILSNQDGIRVERAKWTKADEESLVVLKAVRL